MRILRVVILCSALFTLLGCVKENIPDPYPTTLAINVYDDEGELLDGVGVYLFDDEERFSNAQLTGIAADNIGLAFTDIQNATTDSSSVFFSDLSYDKDYYLYVSFRDRSRFIDLDNFQDNYFVSKDILDQEAITRVDVNLKPARSAVSFYVEGTSDAAFPIQLFIGNDSIGALVSNANATPTTPDDTSGVLPFRLSSGDTWYAYSSLGCIWYGDIEVGNTETFEAVELGSCNGGGITFWIDSAYADYLPIDITLDANDELGRLTKSGEPSSCFGTSGLSVGREPGTYSYLATSSKSGCSWVGEVDVVTGECIFVQLDNCVAQ